MRVPIRTALLAAGLFLLAGSGPAHAQASAVAGGTVWYVRAAATGAGTGASWADAFPDLQAALAAAEPGDEVWVTAGTYRPTTGTDREATFRMQSGVALYGGFNGTETAREERDWDANVTTLSGEIGNPAQSADNSRHVVTADAVDRNAVLDGFTVTQGYDYVNGAATERGGGLLAVAGGPTVRNALFHDNLAAFGGALYVSGGSPIIEDVTFEDNAALNGGGIYVTGAGSAPELRRVWFTRNGAFGAGTYFGGGSGGVVEDAVYEGNTFGTAALVSGSSPRFDRCVFRGNGNLTTASEGSGVRIEGEGARPVFTDCLFEGNLSSGTGAGAFVGGFAAPAFVRATFRANRGNSASGAEASLSTPLFLGCLFEGNRGQAYALASNTAAPVVVNSVFRGNVATSAGGALVFYLNAAPIGTALVLNTAVVGNEAYLAGSPPTGRGGAVIIGSGAPVRFVNVTIAGNRAGESGGAVYALDASGAVFENAVLWGNSAPAGPEIFVAPGGTGPTIMQSIVAGGYHGDGVFDADPRFVRAPSVGADGRWGTADDDYGDLRLAEGSPALDAGLVALLPADVWDLDEDGDTTEAIPVDLAGGPRVVGVSVDLGAYEGAVGVAAEPAPSPAALSLAVAPNPARGAAVALLTLPAASADVRVVVYDGLGREVAVVQAGPLGAGAHRVPLAASGLAPGVYIVRVASGGAAATARLVVVR